jgi:hypothetical protein
VHLAPSDVGEKHEQVGDASGYRTTGRELHGPGNPESETEERSEADQSARPEGDPGLRRFGLTHLHNLILPG